MSLLSIFLVSGQSVWTYLVIPLLLFISRLVQNRYRSGLHKIPGPYIASLTDLWQFFHCLAGRSWRDYELHRKYNSPLLRLGPNLISSDFYISQVQENSRGEPYHNLASTQDEAEHALLRRPVARTYALSTLMAYEPLVDTTFQTFKLQVTQRFVEQGKECPLDKWLQMYAFDVIGELVFSRRLGFLESGTDVDNMMHLTGKVMEYTGIMGHIPYVDKYLRIRNPLRRFIGDFPIIGFTLDRIREHQRQSGNQVHPDFVTQFIKASEKYPDVMTEDRIAENARTAIGAGSDTTAIALREILFRLLVQKSILGKLPSFTLTVDLYITYAGTERFMQELKTQLAARPRDENFDNPISWAEGTKMTFFQALIKECLRYHSPLGQLLPRSVPEGGVTLCGQFIPEGTVVGCNAWTIHRHCDLYGEDADQFRPERWLEATPEQLQKMENMNFAFGGGPRICIGRNIAMLEITKFIPEFFRRFEVQLVDAARYTYHPGWLVTQTGLDVKLRLRELDPLVF
ncbi:hypothetical protein N7451_003109 [Penicillium sp. IBT 35674x]|nr:hypothetical protein N7451_003109 [Penicillium sp. IBT 35674x]